MTWNRRDILRTLPGVALAPAGGNSVQKGPSGERPNVVIIMADQHRAGLTRASGFPLDTMPALDRMSARGVSFDRAYTTAPLCVPARISLLTGRWPHAHRVRQNSAAESAVFGKDLFHVCREMGYRTGLTGKNHSHLTPSRVDLWRPFMHLDGWMPEPAPKEFVAFEGWMKRLNHGTGQEPTPFPLEVQFPYRIVSSAIDFIDSAKDDPFALWVSFPEPHNPYQAPKPYFDMFPPGEVPPRDVGLDALESKSFRWRWLRQLEERTYPGYAERWRRTRSNYLGMLRLIDDQVARLLAHLDSSGKARNTLVLYLADHGDFFCDYGLERKGVDLPEVLTRIPMIWSGWNIRPNAKLLAFVSTADVLPTLCEAIGAEIPFGSQGRSLWPMLTGREYPRNEFESIYSEVGFGGLNYGPEDTIPPEFGRGRQDVNADLRRVEPSDPERKLEDGAHGRLETGVRHDGQRRNLQRRPRSVRTRQSMECRGRRADQAAAAGGTTPMDHSNSGRPAARCLHAEAGAPWMVRKLNRAGDSQEA